MHFTLIAADTPPDFTEANLDLAVVLADGPGEHEGVALDRAEFVTVEAADGGADGWIGWPGCPEDGGAGSISVADAGLALAAAIAGLGRASVPLLLAQAAIDAGRARQIGVPVERTRGYWLIAPTPQWRQKKVKSLVGALTQV